jgi:uncharacterized protein YndB with AHSA1/START domain
VNGSLHTADGRSVLRFERWLAHPVEKVWRAITEPDELDAWFPAQLVGERAPGAKIRFVFPTEGTRTQDREGSPVDDRASTAASEGASDGAAGDQAPTQEGEILEYQPPRLFAYTWGDSVLRWELHPDGPGCRLLFSHTFLDRPFAASYATGWHGCLDALERLLTGRPVPTAATDMADTLAYRSRHEAYVEVFDLLGGSVVETGPASDAGSAAAERPGMMAESAGEPGAGWQARFERLFPYPPDRVWAVLAGPTRPVTGKPAPAAASAEHAPPGPLTEVHDGATLAYRTGTGEVRWALSPGPGGTFVVLSQQVPAAGRVAALVGWHRRLAALAGELAGGAVPRPEPAALQARYTEQVERTPSRWDNPLRTS